MKFLMATLIFIHGLIHVLGFAKAFNYGNIKQLTLPISKSVGILWMISAFYFLLVSFFFILKKDFWWAYAVPAIIISQILITLSWKDAKWGTVANLIILIAAIISWGNNRFEDAYSKDVKENLQREDTANNQLVADADLQRLPLPVRRYLKYVGVIGMPKVHNMRVVMEVQMREKGKDFFNAVSKQYNFFKEPARLFFMQANMFGSIIPGYHRYQNGIASMDIRFAGLIPIVKKDGEVMNKTETVTLFNDMCLMAPATLIDNRIVWESVDDNSVKAVFSNHGISISAFLYFNNQGQLINFLSNDRTDVNSMKNYPFTTPVQNYRNINGYNLFNEGEAVWKYPDGEFVYGRFKLKEIAYNVTN